MEEDRRITKGSWPSSNSHFTVEEARDAVKSALGAHKSGSSAFGLMDRKNAIIEKRKKKTVADGLDPDTIHCNVSDDVAKIPIMLIPIVTTRRIVFDI